MELPRKSQAIELILSMLRSAIRDDATERLAQHSLKLQPFVICMPQLPPSCLSAQMYYCEVRDEGLGQRSAFRQRSNLIVDYSVLTSDLKLRVASETQKFYYH